MKEIIALKNVSLDNWLKNYHLHVFEGEIVCVQSITGESLDALMEVIGGSRKPDKGCVFVDEKKADGYNERMAKETGIYALRFQNNYGKSLKVLDIVLPLLPPWRPYSKKKAKDYIGKYLKEEGIDLSPDTPVWKLSGTQLRKLQILRAGLQQARLIVINLEQEYLEGMLEEELVKMVEKMNRRGTGFLIFSCYYTMFLKTASRVQFLELGRAVREWEEMPENLLEKLRQGSLFYKRAKEKAGFPFLGMYDYEWDSQNSFWDYLNRVRENNAGLWKRYFPGTLLPERGVGYRQGIAVIPGDSKELLLDNLSVGENLTIAAGNRVNYGRTFIINPRLCKKLAEGFCASHQLPERMEELTNVQRKILSIGRFEILRPRVIFLELPYQGISLDELPQLHRYLYSLAEKGISIVYFSQSMEMLQENCTGIIRTRNGLSAKIDTFS